MILLYHRVTSLATDPQLLAVSPRHFAEQLRVIAERYEPISLSSIVCGLASPGASRRDAVALTFDDGYADNFTEAAPLLRENGVPATCFVTSGQIGTEEEFWWDELERLILLADRLPSRLELRIGGTSFVFELGRDAAHTPEQLARHAAWNVTDATVPTRRHALYVELHRALKPIPPAERIQVLRSLRDWAGESSAGRASHRSMTIAELEEMSAMDCIEVGAHTVSHSQLSALEPHEQRLEIENSKARIEEIIGRPVTSFSYPFGASQDFTPTTEGIVRSAGFRSACANWSGCVTRGAGAFQLPRFLVRNWSGDEFARRLDRLRFG